MRRVFIYGLCDPDTGELRYIGKSNNPKKRLSNHLTSRFKSHRTSWIQSLLTKGRRPKLEILLEVPEVEWEFWEKDLIKTFREGGADLVNTSSGGDSFGDLPPESLERQRKARWGRRQSEETREKIRQGHLGKKGPPKSAETRRRISVANKGRKLTPEHKEKLRLSKTGQRNEKNKPQ